MKLHDPCYVVPLKICGLGYSQLLQHRRRKAHYMLRLQRTTATCATTTATGNHENDEAKGSHVQASASTHTDMRLRDEYRAYHGRLVGVR